MNANDRLQAARTAMIDERYEEALALFLWYHDHALAEDRSCAGVRLSFALHYWLELAERYPPALAAFHARRDAKAADLRAGRLDRDLFKDVAAMGGMIGQDALVADLFSELHEAYPAFACQCAPIALPFLGRTGRFALARHYVPNPVLHMRQRAGELVRDVAASVSRPAITAPRYRAEVRNFVDDLQDVLRILRATGAHALAEETRQEALMQLEPEALRKAVSRQLARQQGAGRLDDRTDRTDGGVEGPEVSAAGGLVVPGKSFRLQREDADRILVAVLDSSHASAYRQLLLEAYEKAADAFTTTAAERGGAPDSWWLRRIGSASGAATSFGAWDGDTLIGAVSIEYSAKPKTCHSALVLGMYVRPSHRARGVGRLLLSEAIAAARARPEVCVLTLTLTEGNDMALRLYQSAGFSTWGIEPLAICTASGLKGKVHMSLILRGRE